MCDDNTFIFSTQTDYGNNIDVIEVAIDSSQLLQALLERIDEMDMNENEKYVAYTRALNSLYVITRERFVYGLKNNDTENKER